MRKIDVPPRAWRLPRAPFLIAAVVSCVVASSGAASGDKKPEPFQLQAGQFPPEGTSHYIAGEMIFMDHVNRMGQLRPDRRGDQRTDDYDRPMPFTMLPYGTIRYHGAMAELRDVPIGTHLHGEFYYDRKAGKNGKGAYSLGFLLEDDFSFLKRRERAWRLDDVNIGKGTLTVTGVSTRDKKADAKATVFKVNGATRVWMGSGFGALTNLTPGQLLFINITVATLKGPGRCTDIWIDDESRQLASAHQMEAHRAYERTHGLPGWIDAVDNEKNLLTVTLFSNFDPALTNDFKLKGRVAALVAEDSLRCYDQVNDRMYCEVMQIKSAPEVPGSSGYQLVIKPENLLEGFRPKRILRLLPDKWPLDDNPWEEMLWPQDNRLKL